MDVSEIAIKTLSRRWLPEIFGVSDAEYSCNVLPVLARTVLEQQAEITRLREVERKAIEQAEYIQDHGLTEYEVARLMARIVELFK